MNLFRLMGVGVCGWKYLGKDEFSA